MSISVKYPQETNTAESHHKKTDLVLMTTHGITQQSTTTQPWNFNEIPTDDKTYAATFPDWVTSFKPKDREELRKGAIGVRGPGMF